MSSPRPLFSVLFAGLLVSACGGGGGSGGADDATAENSTEVRSTPEVVDDERVALTSENAEYIVTRFESYTMLLQSLYDPFLAAAQAQAMEAGSVSAMSGITIELGPTVDTGDIAYDGEPEPEPETGGFPALPEDIIAECETSGSASFTYTEDAEGHTTVSSFSDCNGAGAIIDGKVTFRAENFEEGHGFGYHKVTLEGLKFEYVSSYSFILDGVLSFQITPDHLDKIIIYNGTIKDILYGEMQLAKNLTIRMPWNAKFGPSLGYNYEVSGEFRDSELGYVTLGNEPAPGTLVITGKGQSKIRLSVVNEYRVIGVDSDGDASYEYQAFFPWYDRP